MPSLSNEQTQFLEQRLKNRREELRDIIHAELVASDQEDFTKLAGMVHDAGEESFAELVRGINLTNRARELQEIQDVEAALDRIQHGAYGTCVDCHEDIVYERLEAYPTAKRCITCQSRRENRRGGRDATPSL
ncbi:MAG: TraR/DksA family transcriptional regulator [Sulfuricaulis sp.]